MEKLIAKNHILEKDLSILQKKYEEVSNNCEKAYEAIKELENNQENHAISQKLAAENDKLREIIEEKNVQLDAQREEAFLLHTRLEQTRKRVSNIFQKQRIRMQNFLVISYILNLN